MALEGIRLLIQVVELGSVQRAAEQLGVSRSSLRRKLDELEAEVGAELLVRSSVGVTLTPAGATVVDEGRALIARFARMVATARSTTEDAAGHVVLVLPIGMPDVVRVALMGRMRVAASDVCVTEVEHAEPLDHLHEPFDLMFHTGEPPARGQWFSRVLMRFRLVPLASAAYLRAHGRPTTLDDLAGHRLLSWRVAGIDPWAWPLWAGGTVAVTPTFCSHNGQTMHRAAQAGVGIVLGNPAPIMQAGGPPLEPVLADAIGREVTLRCLSPVPVQGNPRTRAIIEDIHAFMSQMPPLA